MVRAGIPLSQVVSEQEEHLETERRLFNKNLRKHQPSTSKSSLVADVLALKSPGERWVCFKLLPSFCQTSICPPPDPGIDQGGTNLSLATSHTRLAS